MKVAIVGGTGKFGQHMARRLEEDHSVSISGSSVEKAERIAGEYGWEHGSNAGIVKDADIIIVSVPISITTDVIHEIGPHVPEDALLTDVTSVKQKPVEAMEQYSSEVLGMHPMYAPSNTVEGQKVVLTPVKGDRWKLMEDFWQDLGAEIHITDPGSHDSAMSVVQGLMHFSELVIAETVERTELEEETDEYSTPVHTLITDLVARMLNQQSELYGAIQSENPRNEDIRENFIESAEHMKEIIGTEEFSGRFDELGDQFDLEESQERSDKVIEYLSNELR